MDIYLEDGGIIYMAVRIKDRRCTEDCDAHNTEFCGRNAASLGSEAICNKLEGVLEGRGDISFKEVK